MTEDSDVDELDRELGWDEEARDSHLVMRFPVVGYLVIQYKSGTPESAHGVYQGVHTVPITQRDNRTGMGKEGDFSYDLPAESNDYEEEAIGMFPATSEAYLVHESKPGKCDWSFARYESAQSSLSVERLSDSEDTDQ